MTTLFTKQFSYVDSILDEIVVTRSLDSASITKSLTYNVDNELESIEVS